MVGRLNSLIFCAILGIVGTASAQTSYPMVMSLHPVAAQTGQTSEHEVSARYDLSGAYKIFVTGTGVTGEVVPVEMKPEEKAAATAASPKKKRPPRAKLKVKFTVAPDALLGVREFRIATPSGASTVGQLVIAKDPVVVEKDPNDARLQAQEITLPATVCGTIDKAEDVDWYQFKVEAGTALSFHVRSSRLQDKIHDLQSHSDPIITIRNASGTTLATADNEFFADPCLRYKFEQAGQYFLEIRDVRYLGNVDWRYSIEINSRPLVTQVFPLAITPGADSKLELVGFQLPIQPTTQIKIPMETPDGPMAVGVPMGDQLSNPVAVFASTLPAVVEVAEDNNTPEKAQLIAVPAGVSGRIETESDVDYYAFEAKKGDLLAVEVVARRLQSRLDAIIRITNDKSGTLAENDDARVGRLTISDSIIETWTAPADGKFFIEIRDLHLRGGAEFVYFLKLTKTQPTFELYLDTDKTILTPGTNGTIFIRAERKHGFTGEIQLAIEGLPEGVTASAGRILATGNDGCIILQAATAAPMNAANIRITGTATHPQADGQPALTLRKEAHPLQELYFPGGGRGHYPVTTHMVSVGEMMDLVSVKLSRTEIVLKPGESQKIEVTIVRSPEFKENITLDVIYRHLGAIYGDSLPKGVTMDEKASQTLLQGGQSTGTIVLTAAADAAPVEKQQVSVMANISLNFVMKMTYSAEPLTVSVVK
jgi:hypothetical protein